ncbi:MAG TPA: DUF493 domain-containing protein [Steroidobacteraceae bacterium]|jgi:putative lipoic acid-binding regulatory protein|nr:DUF493 domain-containing protein [Steroidobacteraceae bacterium]
MEPEKILFPSDYPIKVVARRSDDLRARLDAVFTAQFGAFTADRVTQRDSAQQNFVSYTYLMLVSNVEQLRTLHVELQQTEGVMMVL